MDAQILPQLTRKEQILINRCRLFLQVERLSDISSADRTTILDDWKQANDHTSSRSAKSWPSQGNPGEEAWKIWRLFLDRAFLTNGKLRQNLGKWIQFNPDRIFYARYQESTKTLWHYLNDNKWTSHKLIQSDRRSMLFSNKHESSMPYPPIDSTPIDILSQTDQEIITSPGTQMSNNTAQTQAPSTSLQTRLKLRELDPLFHDIRITVPEEDIRQRLQNTATFDVATDGSYNRISGISSFGWVIAMNQTVIAKAKGPVAAHPTMATPCRAEAYGVASAASFINTMLRHFHESAEKHKWFFLVDNESIIRNFEKYATANITSKWHLNPDADILESAADSLKMIPVNFIHVRSHQDTGKNPNKLSYDAQLNCMADELARQQNLTMTKPYTKRYPDYIHLKINDTIITRESKKWLRDHASRIPIQQYYSQKTGWSTQIFNTIHWSAQQAVMSRYDSNDQRRVLKFVHGWLPTYDRLYREKLANSQRCPLCFYLVENNAHLFNCRNPSQQTIQKSMIDRIRKDNQCNSRRELIHAITEGITHGISDSQWTADYIYDNKKINKWITEQNQIGWSQLINGRLAQSLTQAISDILKNQGTESWYLSAEKWTRRLIQIFWDTMLQLWNNRNKILYDGTQVSTQE
jgi:hypothetical protein